MSYILIYLMVGVAFAFIYDKATVYFETELRLTNRERFYVILLWPIALVMLVWAFLKTINDQ